MMKIEIEITDERIMDLLCSAFEGGAGYWCRINGYVQPKGARPPQEKLGSLDLAPFRHLWLPLVAGGAVKCVEDINERGSKPKRHLLDRAAVERGLVAMAAKCPRHFGDFLAQNEDAETGDVFLQCCLLGEIVYE